MPDLRQDTHPEQESELEEKGYTTCSYDLEKAYVRYLNDEEGSEEAFLKQLREHNKKIDEKYAKSKAREA